MSRQRLSAYRIMWVFVSFDLPTYTRAERKAAYLFRKELLKDGFTMFQFSSYIRHCPSAEHAAVHVRRVKALLPDNGDVMIMTITDRQFKMIEHYSSRGQDLSDAEYHTLDLFDTDD